MRWEDERYVRLYTRDTTDWLALSWFAQGLFGLILRKVDKAGILELGRHGKRGLAAHIGGPAAWASLEGPLEELLADGCVELQGSRLVCPNFIEAQEAHHSDAARKRTERERARAKARTDAPSSPSAAPTSQNVPCDNVVNVATDIASRGVTAGHGEAARPDEKSPDPIRSVPNDPNDPNDAIRSGARATEAAEPPAPACAALHAPAAPPPHRRATDADEVLENLKRMPCLSCLASVDYAEKIAKYIDVLTPGRSLVDAIQVLCEVDALEAKGRVEGSRRGASDLISIVLSRFRQAKPRGGPVALEPTEEQNGAELVRKLYGARWTLWAKGAAYSCPDADLGPAGKVWAEATKRAAALAADAKGGPSPRAEDIAAHWLDRHFAEPDKKLEDGGRPIGLVVYRCGTYGLPTVRKPRSAPPAMAPEPAPGSGRPTTAAILSTALSLGAADGGTGIIMPRPGAAAGARAS